MLSYQVTAFGKPLAQALRAVPRPQGCEVVVRIGECAQLDFVPPPESERSPSVGVPVNIHIGQEEAGRR